MATVTSIVSSYSNLVVSAAGAESDLAAATGYNIGVPAPGTTALAPKDLLIKHGGGKHTYATNVELLCYATSNNNDTCTMSIYGISDSGPPERIASLIYIFGTALVSSGVRWADSCTRTDTHTGTVTAFDTAANRIVKVTLDTDGYRYLYAIIHTTTTGAATNITVLMRPFS